MRALALLCLALPAAGAENLALHKPVRFLPQPNYANTARGGSDAADLTDGLTSAREDRRIWLDPASVGWFYIARANLAVDLGRVEPIGEVAIRFVGGSAVTGATLPSWVEVLVSDGPGEPFYRAAEYLLWRDAAKFEVPRSEGKAWVHRLRFQNLKTRGRMVGIRFYGSPYTASDELYVYRGAHRAETVRRDPRAVTDFTVAGGHLYFHRPFVPVAENLVAPLAMGFHCPPGEPRPPLEIALDLPPGIRLEGGKLGGVPLGEARTATPGRYLWKLGTAYRPDKLFGRLWITGKARPGAEIRYRVKWGDYTSPEVRYPIRMVAIPRPTRRPEKLTVGLSWWQIDLTAEWPGWRNAFETVGLNALPVLLPWFDPNDAATVRLVDEARRAGYRIHAIDSTLNLLQTRRKDEPEIFCQFAEGSHGGRLCPSYRGRFWDEEVERVAAALRVLRPALLHLDIEIWNGGPRDAEKCTRCRADRERSGLPYDEWLTRRGYEMWTALWAAAAREAARHGDPPPEMSNYGFRPGAAFQRVWPFDRLYPRYVGSSQPVIYSPLEPHHIRLAGDQVRRDRALLPKSDVFPWLTPGDGGPLPAERLYCQILEAFFNGARGINFWSGRVWDAEALAGYARAIRTVTPVEEILAGGAPFAVETEGPGRVSGIRRGDDVLLLAADYWGETGGAVKVKLDFPRPMRVQDLATGREAGTLAAGPRTLTVKLGGEMARPLRLRP